MLHTHRVSLNFAKWMRRSDEDGAKELSDDDRKQILTSIKCAVEATKEETIATLERSH